MTAPGETSGLLSLWQECKYSRAYHQAADFSAQFGAKPLILQDLSCRNS